MSNSDEIKKFDDLIFNELCKRRLLESEIRIIENQISSFLRDYCRDLEGIFHEIDHAEKLLNDHLLGRNLDQPENAPNDNNTHYSQAFFDTEKGSFIKSQMDEKDKHEAFNEELSGLYRNLVKFCHPDSSASNDPDAREVFDMVQSAYEARDLKTLIMLERILSSDDKEKKERQNNDKDLNKSKDFYNKLINENENIFKKKESLISSPSFHLERRIRLAQMNGEDPIQSIRESALQDRNIKLKQLEKLGITLEEQKNDCA